MKKYKYINLTMLLLLQFQMVFSLLTLYILYYIDNTILKTMQLSMCDEKNFFSLKTLDKINILTLHKNVNKINCFYCIP